MGCFSLLCKLSPKISLDFRPLGLRLLGLLSSLSAQLLDAVDSQVEVDHPAARLPVAVRLLLLSADMGSQLVVGDLEALVNDGVEVALAHVGGHLAVRVRGHKRLGN